MNYNLRVNSVTKMDNLRSFHCIDPPFGIKVIACLLLRVFYLQSQVTTKEVVEEVCMTFKFYVAGGPIARVLQLMNIYYFV